MVSEILCSGGRDDLWVLDTVTLVWTEVRPACKIGTNCAWPGQLYSHTLAAVGDKMFLIGGATGGIPMGGSFPPVSDCQWVFEASTRTWKWLNPPLPVQDGETSPSARRFHTLTTVETEMYLYGGLTQNSVSGDLWRLQFAIDATTARAGRWSIVHFMTYQAQPQPRHSHAATTNGSDLYLHGGMLVSGKRLCDLWRFSTATTTWKQIIPAGPTPSARLGHTTVTSGAVTFLFGGSTDFGLSGELWRMQIVNDEVAEWSLIVDESNMPRARSFHTAAVIKTDLYVHGGQTEMGASSELWKFCTSTQQWSLLDESVGVLGLPPSARFRHAMTASEISGDIFLHGGETVPWGKGCNEFWKFSTTSLKWTQVPVGTEETARLFGHSMAAVSLVNVSQLWIFGGATGAFVDLMLDSKETFYRVIDIYIDWKSPLSSMTRAHDGDTIIVSSDEDWLANIELTCSKISCLPCSIAIVGLDDRVTLQRHASARIVCAQSSGCTGIAISRVTVECDPDVFAAEAPLQLSGEASLVVRGATFSRCSAAADGGSIRVFDNADLIVSHSVFLRSSSQVGR